MANDRLKTARDEILEAEAANRPTVDPQTEQQRLIDSTLRLIHAGAAESSPDLGTRKAAFEPGRVPNDTLDGRPQAPLRRDLGIDSTVAASEGTRARSLPVERQQSGSVGSATPHDSRRELAGSTRQSTRVVKEAEPLPSTNSQQVSPASGDLPLATLPSFDTSSVDASSSDTDGWTPQAQLLDMKPSDVDQAEIKGDDNHSADVCDRNESAGPEFIDANQLSDSVPSRQRVISSGQIATQDVSTAYESSTATVDGSTGAESEPAVLPPWPIMTVDIKDAPRLVHSEMESFTRKLEELACAIAKKEVDDHEYREFAQRRALYWDR